MIQPLAARLCDYFHFFGVKEAPKATRTEPPAGATKPPCQGYLNCKRASEPNVENAGVTRKLAVILAADVAGYSRLMAADDEGTLATLNVRRQVIDELITRHHGRIFTTAGDSVMAEFASPVEAVRCAAAIQQEIERRNADLPEPRRMLFRVGVNLGDVMVGGDNLFGDGVNVAARLEGVAEPGGIASPAQSTIRSGTRSTSASTTSANDRLRTSATRSGSSACGGMVPPSPDPSRSGRQGLHRPGPLPCRQSPCSRSRTLAAIPSRRTSPTASPRT